MNRKSSGYLSDVHSTGGLEPVVADGFGFLFEKITKLVFLNTLLSYAPHDLVPLLQAHPTSISIVTNKIRHSFQLKKVNIEIVRWISERDLYWLVGLDEEEEEAEEIARDWISASGGASVAIGFGLWGLQISER